MISFCCGFYPWYREHDRTNEVFDVLIAGLNTMYGVEDCELSIVNAGVVDVWRHNTKPDISRKLNSYEFKERICKEFKGKVKYLLDDESIQWANKGGSQVPRYWTSKSFQKAIDISSNDYILIVGIDCYITGYFITDYFTNVKRGHSWVVMATAAGKVDDIQYYESDQLKRYYYTPKGIVGIHKKDFYEIGGYDLNYIKDKVDTNFYLRMIESDKLVVKEERVNNVYHVYHPGTHMGGASRYNSKGKVETCKFA